VNKNLILVLSDYFDYCKEEEEKQRLFLWQLPQVENKVQRRTGEANTYATIYRKLLDAA
jgi:hypothetical protein